MGSFENFGTFCLTFSICFKKKDFIQKKLNLGFQGPPNRQFLKFLDKNDKVSKYRWRILGLKKGLFENFGLFC